MADNRTGFEKLLDIIGVKVNAPSKSDKKVISAPTPGELQQKKKEIHQEQYFANQYKSIINRDYYQYMLNESERIYAYADFESMEHYPLISTALNIFAEEATTVNDQGKVLNIYSESKRVKSVLEELFFNRLNLNANLYYWTRNLVKYGDNFLYNILDAKEGIIGAKQLPNIEMKRRESYNDEKGRIVTEFLRDELNDVYTNFQITHFRMLGDLNKAPYGLSVLEKIRKLHKMLVLADDAMMIFRLTRSVSRKVFKIDVGNINDNEVGEYINKIANEFKKVSEVDTKTGKTEFRYNLYNVTQDYFVPIRNNNNGTVIDNIEGAPTPDTMDVEYLRDNLLTGLEIPKQFLGFEEATGEGKNLSMMDIRFARKINRIQQCVIQELNKMAIIHLKLLGLDDELDNFSISLNNPSIQSEILKIENITNKLTAYTSAITINESTQIAPMSEARAKKQILGMSSDEIIDDIKQQFFERGIGEEFRNKVDKIGLNSGIFDEIIEKYGTREIEEETGGGDQGGGDEPGGPIGGDDAGGDEPAGGDDEGGADIGGGDEGGGDEPAGGGNPFAESKTYLTEDLIQSIEKSKSQVKRIFDENKSKDMLK